MIKLNVFFCIVTASVLVAGCDLVARNCPSGDIPAASSLITYTTAAKKGDNYHKRLADIVEEVPGYGGHFLETLSNGNYILNVFLLEPNQESAEHAHDLINQVVGDPVVSAASVKPVQGEYDFRQLYNWLNELAEDVPLSRDEISFVTIHEGINKIQIAALNEDVIDSLKVKISGTSIPAGAIDYIVAGHAETADCN